jgi:hypothetical protein
MVGRGSISRSRWASSLRKLPGSQPFGCEPPPGRGSAGLGRNLTQGPAGCLGLGPPVPGTAAGPRPETQLAGLGYKRKRAIDQPFPFQCSHDAASPDGAASLPRRRRRPGRLTGLRAGQWELFVFFARPARSALLISGRRKTSITRSPIPSTLCLKFLTSYFLHKSRRRRHGTVARSTRMANRLEPVPRACIPNLHEL